MKNREILDSWKEIAAYLGRSEKTCRRLEKELGLPVHRLEETPKARVYAYKDEIDQWIQKTQHSEEIPLTPKKIAEKFRLKKILIPALVFVAIVAMGIILWRVIPFSKQTGEREAFTLQKPEIDPGRIAVAIFENRTGNPDLDHLGFMVHDWITQGLQQVGDISVAGQVPEKNPDERENQTDIVHWISAETYAGKVVIGAYYLQGATLEFQSQLHDAIKGKLLHALEPVSGSIENPVETIETLRQKVMSQLAIYGYEKWRSFIKPETELPDYEAYIEFTEGLRLFLTMEYQKAITYFKRASELDPDFLTPVFFWFAASTNLGEYTEAKPLLKKLEQNRNRLSLINRLLLDFLKGSLTGNRVEQFNAIRQAAQLDSDNNYLYGLLAIWVNRPRKAIAALKALDPEKVWVPYWRKLTMAYHMLGEHDLELAEARLGRKLHPEIIDPLFCEMRAHAALGRIDEIDRLIEESLNLLPQPIMNPGQIMLWTGLELKHQGYKEASLKTINRSLEWHKNRPQEEVETAVFHYTLAQVYYFTDIWEEAKVLIKALHRENPENLDYHGFLGMVKAQMGDREGALEISRELEELDRPYLQGTHTFWRARIASALGEKETAMKLLREALAQGVRYDALHWPGFFETLWDYPPYKELMRPKG